MFRVHRSGVVNFFARDFTWVRLPAESLPSLTNGVSMATSIYIGNLAWSTTEDSISNLFSNYGNVISVKLPLDRENGRPRGFGFVEMDDADASRAISALNGQDLDGRTLRVNKAEPKKPARSAW